MTDELQYLILLVAENIARFQMSDEACRKSPRSDMTQLFIEDHLTQHKGNALLT